MTNVRAAYLDASVATASPARLLLMLCDRLVLDVTRAAEALRAGEILGANDQLVHAQNVVLELRSSLRVDSWAGGPALASIYDFLHTELVHANVVKDVAAVEECLVLAEQIAGTWREAALQNVAV